MQSKQQIQLNEKDSLQDMLNLEKEIVKLYSTALTEGNGSKFRTMVKNHLVDSANDQFEVFTQMAENNYYEVKPADKAVIDEQKANFKQVLAQLGHEQAEGLVAGRPLFCAPRPPRGAGDIAGNNKKITPYPPVGEGFSFMRHKGYGAVLRAPPRNRLQNAAGSAIMFARRFSENTSIKQPR